MTIDILLRDYKFIIIAIGLMVGVIIIAFLMRVAMKKKKSAVATTALIKKSILTQSAKSTPGTQLELNAKQYEIDQTLEEIKQNILRITMQKNEIITLVEDLKEKVLQKELKHDVKQLDDVRYMVDEIKVKLIEIQAKTNSFCSLANIARLEEEIPKITPAARIRHAKDQGLLATAVMAEIVKSTELDKKHFQHLLKIVKDLPKEIKSFAAFIESQVKAIQHKLEEFLKHIFKGEGKEELLKVIKEPNGKHKESKSVLEALNKAFMPHQEKKGFTHAAEGHSETKHAETKHPGIKSPEHEIKKDKLEPPSPPSFKLK